LIISPVNRFKLFYFEMQFSASLVTAFAAYTAAQSGNVTISSSVAAPIIAVPVTRTVSSYLTYCPSPTAFRVGEQKLHRDDCNLCDDYLPKNGCPMVSAVVCPTIVPMAPFSNATAPFRNITASAQCHNAVSSSVNGSARCKLIGKRLVPCCCWQSL
jgi:hypothetical protein